MAKAQKNSSPEDTPSKPPLPTKVKSTGNIRDIMQDMFDPDFWRKKAPNFNIEGEIEDYAFPLSNEEKAEHQERVLIEGYTHLHEPGFKVPLPEMAALFTQMVEQGLPPVFSFVYDEFWLLSKQLHNLIDGVLDTEYAMLPDFWAWHIEPGKAGFTPHRDKGPDSLFPDRTPKSVTVWLPLTETHPLNGCMYILPADRDPSYGLDSGFNGKLVDIRALPGNPGDAFMWTQHAMHWGCHAADKHKLPPRMSVAFEYQRTDVPAFNNPLLEPGIVPPFEIRLALIAKQIMQYKHLYNAPPELINAAQTILSKLVPPHEQEQQNTYGTE